MTTKTKQIMDEEIERFAQQYTESGQWKDGKIITPQMIQAFIRQSIIRILETAMEEVIEIKVVEVPSGTPIFDSDQVFVAGQMNVMMRTNDRIQSILNSVKE